MTRPVLAKDPWARAINHRTPSAPKGQNEIAQGRAKRRPGYGSALISAPLGSAPSGRDSIMANNRARNRGQSPRERVIGTYRTQPTKWLAVRRSSSRLDAWYVLAS